MLTSANPANSPRSMQGGGGEEMAELESDRQQLYMLLVSLMVRTSGRHQQASSCLNSGFERCAKRCDIRIRRCWFGWEERVAPVRDC